MNQVGEYRRLYEEILTGTTGRQLRKFQPIVREVAFSLIICPGSVSWGLYYKPLGHLSHDMGRTEKQIHDSMKILSALDYAHYDPASEFIWVKNMAAVQHRPLPLKAGDNRVKAARNWYRKVPRNPFLGPFFDQYDAGLWLSHLDVHPGTEVQRRTGGDILGMALQQMNEPPEPMLFEEGELPPPPKKLSATEQMMADFEEWWPHYPDRRRQGKGEARDEWMKKKPPADDQTRRIDVLERQKQTRDWTKDNGDFIPAPAKYIKQERWNDTVALKQTTELSRVNEANRRTMEEIARDGKL